MNAPRRAKRPGTRYEETERALELMRRGISPWRDGAPRRARPMSKLKARWWAIRDAIVETINAMFGDTK